jgi:hypothetical protein
VSGLGHYIEREGVPTAGISLVREHTESARPPRALYVPFDFGLPFGAPHDADLQHRVLFALLKLFERDRGPVLEILVDDGEEDRIQSGAGVWSCPLPAPTGAGGSESVGVQALEKAVQAELLAVLPWYEHAAAERGRTTVGASGLDISSLVPFIAAFQSTPPPNPSNHLPLPLVLKAAVEDLKQVYLEAASARPEAREINHRQLNDWFWRETRAAEMLRDVARAAQSSGDKNLDIVARMLLVPAAYL